MEFLRHLYAGLMGALMVSLIVFFLDIGGFSDHLKASPNLWTWAGVALLMLVAFFAWLSKMLTERMGLYDGL